MLTLSREVGAPVRLPLQWLPAPPSAPTLGPPDLGGSAAHTGAPGPTL